MIRILLLSFFLLTSIRTWAQLPTQVDSLKLSKSIFGKSDSLKQILTDKKDSLTKLQNIPQQKISSLKEKQKALNSRIDSVKQKISYRLDSLKSRDSSDTLLIKKYTAQRYQLDSIQQKLALNDLTSGINSKAEITEEQFNAKLEQLNTRVNEVSKGKLNAPLSNRVDVGNPISLPQYNDQKFALPSPGNPLSNINSPDFKIPDTSINSIGSASASAIPNTTLPQTDNGIDMKVPEIIGAEKFSQVQEKTGELGELKTKVEELKEEGLNEAEVSKEIEQKITELDRLEKLKEQVAINPMAKNLDDPEVAKEMFFNRGKEEAMNHFAGHEQELIATMEQFAKIRSEIKNPEETIDMLKNGRNSLQNKKIIERIIPGFSFQIQKPNAFWFDFNPSIGYEVLSKFALHLGWNYRVAYHKEGQWMKGERVYGPRSMVEFAWREFFSFIGQAEVMNTPIKQNGNPALLEYSHRAWVWSYMIGTKASYKISKTVRGNAQVLYNLYDPTHDSPYGDRLNLRMGIEINLKKKIKNTAQVPKN